MNSPFRPAKPAKARLTVQDFLLLDANGSFVDYAKTELIDGEIFYLNAQHRPHARIKTRLAIALAHAIEGNPGLEVVVEGAVEIPPHNIPEPDILVTDEAEGEGLVPLGSVKLVVEVSDSSLANDLGAKARLYASSGVQEYWVVDIEAKRIHQFWGPVGESYGEKRELSFGDRLVAATLPGLAMETVNL